MGKHDAASDIRLILPRFGFCVSKKVRPSAERDIAVTPFPSMSAIPPTEGALDELLLESVHDTLKGIFGAKVPEAIYKRLETNYSISPEEIPNRLSEFVQGLEGLFDRASKPVERAIAKRLYSKLGLRFVEMHSLGLLDYLNEVKGAGKDIGS